MAWHHFECCEIFYSVVSFLIEIEQVSMSSKAALMINSVIKFNFIVKYKHRKLSFLQFLHENSFIYSGFKNEVQKLVPYGKNAVAVLIVYLNWPLIYIEIYRIASSSTIHEIEITKSRTVCKQTN